MFDFPAISRFYAKSLWNHSGFATIVKPCRDREGLSRNCHTESLLHAWEIRRPWWRSWRIYRNFKEDAERLIGRLLELFELATQRGEQLVLCGNRKLRIFQLMDQFFCFVSSRQQFRRTGGRILD